MKKKLTGINDTLWLLLTPADSLISTIWTFEKFYSNFVNMMEANVS